MSKPRTSIRLMTQSDLAEVVAIEQETFGYWDRKQFEVWLKSRDILAFVAAELVANETAKEYRGRGRIVGLLVLQVNQYSIHVINMAAITSKARLLLIDRANNRASRHRRELIWREE